MGIEVTEEEVQKSINDWGGIYDLDAITRTILAGEVPIEISVVAALRLKLKPLIEEAQREDEELARKFLEGTGVGSSPTGAIYLDEGRGKSDFWKTFHEYHALGLKKTKPPGMSPLEWLRRNS